MSANHVRRHRTARAEVVDLAERRLSRTATLLSLRDRLAVTIAERESHDLEVVDLYLDLHDLEAAIKKIAPQVYADRWADWVQRDVELMHDAENPRQGCSLCTAYGLVQPA